MKVYSLLKILLERMKISFRFGGGLQIQILIVKKKDYCLLGPRKLNSEHLLRKRWASLIMSGKMRLSE